MNLLAIDAAADQFSVALSAHTNTWFFQADAGLRHSELIMDSVDMLLRSAALKPADLCGVLCMGGPGSFTGLRIGFSYAKGLALALNIPFAAVPTLDCLAWPFSAWPGMVAPVLDAKKKCFFCALYRGGKRLTPDMDAPPATIAAAISAATATATAATTAKGAPEQTLLIGPGAELLYEQLDLQEPKPQIQRGEKLQWGNAKTLLAIARETGIIAPGAAYDNNTRGPEYIRKSDAEIQSTENRE